MKKTKQNKNNVFLDSYKFLLDSKKFIFVAVILFFLSFILGLFISPSPQILDAIKKLIEELLKQTKGMSLLQLIWFIFWNNLKL